MAKLDEIREILNTLRIMMSIAFGMLVVLIGSIIKRYDAHSIDVIFWTGVAFTFILLLFIVAVVVKISNKTKEIKDL